MPFGDGCLSRQRGRTETGSGGCRWSGVCAHTDNAPTPTLFTFHSRAVVSTRQSGTSSSCLVEHCSCPCLHFSAIHPLPQPSVRRPPIHRVRVPRPPRPRHPALAQTLPNEAPYQRHLQTHLFACASMGTRAYLVQCRAAGLYGRCVQYSRSRAVMQAMSMRSMGLWMRGWGGARALLLGVRDQGNTAFCLSGSPHASSSHATATA